MCGILGFFDPAKTGRAPYADKIMPELLFVGQVRGRDSVGLFGAKKDHPEVTDYVKSVGSADAFLGWKEPHDRFLKDADDFKFMVGHNRAATRGARDDVKAAHPHVTKNILLVHNGTLNSFPEKMHVSDSAYIAHLLEEEQNFAEVERKLFGAWALVWWDARTKRLNFARNSQRPLGFIRDNGGVWWFASEPGMLRWVLNRNYREVKEYKPLEQDMWISIGLDGDIVERRVGFSQGSTSMNTSGSTATSKTLSGTHQELKRAFETVSNGGKGCKLSIEDITEDITEKGKGFPRPLALPSHSYSGRYGRLLESHRSNTTASPASSEESSVKKPRHILVDEFAGLLRGDKAMCWPVVWRGSVGGKTTIGTGPLLIWTEKGEPEFLDGVVGNIRIDDDYDSAFSDMSLDQKLKTYGALRCPVEFIITSLTFCEEEDRMYIHGDRAMPQDWMRADLWDMDEAEIEACYKRTIKAEDKRAVLFPHKEKDTAPEVAVVEKKSSTAE